MFNICSFLYAWVLLNLLSILTFSCIFFVPILLYFTLFQIECFWLQITEIGVGPRDRQCYQEQISYFVSVLLFKRWVRSVIDPHVVTA